MPLASESYPDRVVKPFFAGLLPDGNVLANLAAKLGLSMYNSYGLLEKVGGDCAGAVSIISGDNQLPDFHPEQYHPLTEAELHAILTELPGHPLLADSNDQVRLCLAGANPKLPVCMIDGAIIKNDGRPSTHILKLEIEQFENIVVNELFCLTLAARLGLDAANAKIATCAKIDYLLVERYDRKAVSKFLCARLHQEDFCQALSMTPDLKYETDNEAEGDSYTAKSFQLINDVSESPSRDRIMFMRALIFNYLIGNADAHAKNYSLLYNNKIPNLAPLYDTVCTDVYSGLSKNLAMSIGGQYQPYRIYLEHWHSLVPDTGTARKTMTGYLRDLAEAIIPEAEDLRNEMGAEGRDDKILDQICEVISDRANNILNLVAKAAS